MRQKKKMIGKRILTFLLAIALLATSIASDASLLVASASDEQIATEADESQEQPAQTEDGLDNAQGGTDQSGTDQSEIANPDEETPSENQTDTSDEEVQPSDEQNANEEIATQAAQNYDWENESGEVAYNGGGSGTQDDPYVLLGAEDLKKLAHNIHAINEYSKGKYFKVRAESQAATIIDLTGTGIQIGETGSAEKYFYGKMEFIEVSVMTDKPLFGCVGGGASISSLKITSNCNDSADGNYLGGVIQEIRYGYPTYDNSLNEDYHVRLDSIFVDSLSIETTSAKTAIGGVVGRIHNELKNTTLNVDMNAVEVNSGSIQGNAVIAVGGLIGTVEMGPEKTEAGTDYYGNRSIESLDYPVNVSMTSIKDSSMERISNIASGRGYVGGYIGNTSLGANVTINGRDNALINPTKLSASLGRGAYVGNANQAFIATSSGAMISDGTSEFSDKAVEIDANSTNGGYLATALNGTVYHNVDMGNGISGDGTEKNPYIIKNTNDLLMLAIAINTMNSTAMEKFDTLNITSRVDKREYLTHAYYQVTGDIDLNETGFKGIGFYISDSFYQGFHGSFAGKQFTANDGTMRYPVIHFDNTYAQGKAGLFAMLYGTDSNNEKKSKFPINNTQAVVKNLNLSGNIYAGSNYIGGIAGLISNGTVSNCGVNIRNIQSSLNIKTESGSYIGGLVGYGQFSKIKTKVALEFENISIQRTASFGTTEENWESYSKADWYNTKRNSDTGDAGKVTTVNSASYVGGLIGALQSETQAEKNLRVNDQGGLDIAVKGYYFNGSLQASGYGSSKYYGGMIGAILSPDSYTASKAESAYTPYADFKINYESTKLTVANAYVAGENINAYTAGGYISSASGVNADMNNIVYGGTVNSRATTAGVIAVASGTYKMNAIKIEGTANVKANASYYAGYLFANSVNAWVDVDMAGFSVGQGASCASNAGNHADLLSGQVYQRKGNVYMAEAVQMGGIINLSDQISSITKGTSTPHSDMTRYYYDATLDSLIKSEKIKGKGTEEEPYVIDSAKKLQILSIFNYLSPTLSWKLLDCFESTGDDSYTDINKVMYVKQASFKLKGELNMSELSFYPMPIIGGSYKGEGADKTVIKFGDNTNKCTSDSSVKQNSPFHDRNGGLFVSVAAKSSSKAIEISDLTLTGEVKGVFRTGALISGFYIENSSDNNNWTGRGVVKGNLNLHDITLKDLKVRSGNGCSGLLIGDIAAGKHSLTNIKMSMSAGFVNELKKGGESNNPYYVGTDVAESGKGTVSGYKVADALFGNVSGSKTLIQCYKMTFGDLWQYMRAGFVGWFYSGNGYYLYDPSEDKDVDGKFNTDWEYPFHTDEKFDDGSTYAGFPASFGAKEFKINPPNTALTLGDGSENSPYIINDATQLIALENVLGLSLSGDDTLDITNYMTELSGSDGKTQWITAESTEVNATQLNAILNHLQTSHYRLAKDIDFSAVYDSNKKAYFNTFTGIGTDERPFKGELDGRGFTILFSRGTNTDTVVNFGLFKYISGATISNLTLTTKGKDITTGEDRDYAIAVQDKTSDWGGAYNGGFAAVVLANDNTLSHVRSNVTFKVMGQSEDTKTLYVGGLAGSVKSGTLILQNMPQNFASDFKVLDSNEQQITYGEDETTLSQFYASVVPYQYDGYVINKGDVETNELVYDTSKISSEGYQAKVNEAFSATVNFDNKYDGCKFSIVNDASFDGYKSGLPEGVTLDENGTLSGIPLEGGDFETMIQIKKDDVTDYFNIILKVSRGDVPDVWGTDAIIPAGIKVDDTAAEQPTFVIRIPNAGAPVVDGTTLAPFGTVDEEQTDENDHITTTSRVPFEVEANENFNIIKQEVVSTGDGKSELQVTIQPISTGTGTLTVTKLTEDNYEEAQRQINFIIGKAKVKFAIKGAELPLGLNEIPSDVGIGDIEVSGLNYYGIPNGTTISEIMRSETYLKIWLSNLSIVFPKEDENNKVRLTTGNDSENYNPNKYTSPSTDSNATYIPLRFALDSQNITQYTSEDTTPITYIGEDGNEHTTTIGQFIQEHNIPTVAKENVIGDNAAFEFTWEEGKVTFNYGESLYGTDADYRFTSATDDGENKAQAVGAKDDQTYDSSIWLNSETIYLLSGGAEHTYLKKDEENGYTYQYDKVEVTENGETKEYDLTANGFTVTGEGVHKLQLKLKDSKTGVYSDTFEVTVNVDRTKPTLSINFVENRSKKDDSVILKAFDKTVFGKFFKKLQINWKASDLKDGETSDTVSGVSKIQYQKLLSPANVDALSEDGWEDLSNFQAVDADANSVESGSVLPGMGGLYTWYFRSVDAAGNVSEVVTHKYKVDADNTLAKDGAAITDETKPEITVETNETDKWKQYDGNTFSDALRYKFADAETGVASGGYTIKYRPSASSSASEETEFAKKDSLFTDASKITTQQSGELAFKDILKGTDGNIKDGIYTIQFDAKNNADMDAESKSVVIKKDAGVPTITAELADGDHEDGNVYKDDDRNKLFKTIHVTVDYSAVVSVTSIDNLKFYYKHNELVWQNLEWKDKNIKNLIDDTSSRKATFDFIVDATTFSANRVNDYQFSVTTPSLLTNPGQTDWEQYISATTDPAIQVENIDCYAPQLNISVVKRDSSNGFNSDTVDSGIVTNQDVRFTLDNVGNVRGKSKIIVKYEDLLSSDSREQTFTNVNQTKQNSEINAHPGTDIQEQWQFYVGPTTDNTSIGAWSDPNTSGVILRKYTITITAESGAKDEKEFILYQDKQTPEITSVCFEKDNFATNLVNQISKAITGNIVFQRTTMEVTVHNLNAILKDGQANSEGTMDMRDMYLNFYKKGNTSQKVNKEYKINASDFTAATNKEHKTYKVEENGDIKFYIDWPKENLPDVADFLGTVEVVVNDNAGNQGRSTTTVDQMLNADNSAPTYKIDVKQGNTSVFNSAENVKENTDYSKDERITKWTKENINIVLSEMVDQKGDSASGLDRIEYYPEKDNTQVVTVTLTDTDKTKAFVLAPNGEENTPNAIGETYVIRVYDKAENFTETKLLINKDDATPTLAEKDGLYVETNGKDTNGLVKDNDGNYVLSNGFAASDAGITFNFAGTTQSPYKLKVTYTPESGEKQTAELTIPVSQSSYTISAVQANKDKNTDLETILKEMGPDGKLTFKLTAADGNGNNATVKIDLNGHWDPTAPTKPYVTNLKDYATEVTGEGAAAKVVTWKWLQSVENDVAVEFETTTGAEETLEYVIADGYQNESALKANASYIKDVTDSKLTFVETKDGIKKYKLNKDAFANNNETKIYSVMFRVVDEAGQIHYSDPMYILHDDQQPSTKEPEFYNKADISAKDAKEVASYEAQTKLAKKFAADDQTRIFAFHEDVYTKQQAEDASLDTIKKMNQAGIKSDNTVKLYYTWKAKDAAAPTFDTENIVTSDATKGWVLYNASSAPQVLNASQYTWYFCAVDAAGNVSEVTSAAIADDSTEPKAITDVKAKRREKANEITLAENSTELAQWKDAVDNVVFTLPIQENTKVSDDAKEYQVTDKYQYYITKLDSVDATADTSKAEWTDLPKGTTPEKFVNTYTFAENGCYRVYFRAVSYTGMGLSTTPENAVSWVVVKDDGKDLSLKVTPSKNVTDGTWTNKATDFTMNVNSVSPAEIDVYLNQELTADIVSSDKKETMTLVSSEAKIKVGDDSKGQTVYFTHENEISQTDTTTSGGWSATWDGKKLTLNGNVPKDTSFQFVVRNSTETAQGTKLGVKADDTNVNSFVVSQQTYGVDETAKNLENQIYGLNADKLIEAKEENYSNPSGNEKVSSILSIFTSDASEKWFKYWYNTADNGESADQTGNLPAIYVDTKDQAYNYDAKFGTTASGESTYPQVSIHYSLSRADKENEKVNPTISDSNAQASVESGSNQTLLTNISKDGDFFQILKQSEFTQDGYYTLEVWLQDEAGNQTAEVTRKVYVDRSNPTEIKLEAGDTVLHTSVIEKVLNKISFGNWFNAEKQIKLSANTAVSGEEELSYYLDESSVNQTADSDDYAKLLAGTSELKQLSVAELEKLDEVSESKWKTWNADSKIPLDFRGVIYVRVKDKAGNITYANSDVLMLEEAAPKAEVTVSNLLTKDESGNPTGGIAYSKDENGDFTAVTDGISTDSFADGISYKNYWLKEKPELSIKVEDPAGESGVKSGIKSVVVKELDSTGKELYKESLYTDNYSTESKKTNVKYSVTESYTVQSEGEVTLKIEVTDLSGNKTETFATTANGTEDRDSLKFQIDTKDPAFIVSTSRIKNAFGTWQNSDYIVEITNGTLGSSNQVKYYYRLVDSTSADSTEDSTTGEWTAIKGTSIWTDGLYDDNGANLFLHKTLQIKAVSGSGRETIQSQNPVKDGETAQPYEIKIQKEKMLYQKSGETETGWRTWTDASSNKIYQITDSMKDANGESWSNTAKDVRIKVPYEYVAGKEAGYTPDITTHVEIWDVTTNVESKIYGGQVTLKSDGKDGENGGWKADETTNELDKILEAKYEEGNLTFTLKADKKYEVRVYVTDEAGNTTALGTVACVDKANYNIDTTAPTNYDIKADNSTWHRIWAGTIGKWFFKNTSAKMDVSYNADISKIQKVQYLAVPLENNDRKKALEDLEAELKGTAGENEDVSGKNNTTSIADPQDTLLRFVNGVEEGASVPENAKQNWTDITNNTFNVDPDFTGVYYIYLEDKAGNYVLYGTDGFSVEKTVPSKCEITNISGYKTDKNAENSKDAEDASADKVYKSASYTFQVQDMASGIDKVEVVLQDKSANNSEKTFTFYQSAQEGWTKDEGTEIAKWKTNETNDRLLLKKVDVSAEEMIPGAGSVYEGTIRCLQSGIYQIVSVTAYDHAGNTKAASLEKNPPVTVDNAEPELVVNADSNYENNTWTNKDLTFDLSSSEKVLTDVTYWYTIDDSTVAYAIDTIQSGRYYEAAKVQSWGTVTQTGKTASSSASAKIVFNKDTNHKYTFYLAMGAKAVTDDNGNQTLDISDGAKGTAYTYLTCQKAENSTVSNQIKIQKSVPEFYADADYKVYNYDANKALTGDNVYTESDLANASAFDWYNKKLALNLTAQDQHVTQNGATVLNSDPTHQFAPVSTNYVIKKSDEKPTEKEWQKDALKNNGANSTAAEKQSILVNNIGTADKADGTWNLYVQVVDEAGNIAQAENTGASGDTNSMYQKSFQVDTTNPEIKSATYADKSLGNWLEQAEAAIGRIFGQSGKKLTVSTDYNVSGRRKLYVQFREFGSNGNIQDAVGDVDYTAVKDGDTVTESAVINGTNAEISSVSGSSEKNPLPRNTWLEIPTQTGSDLSKVFTSKDFTDEIENLWIAKGTRTNGDTTTQVKDFAGTVYVIAIDAAGNKEEGWFNTGIELDDTAPTVELTAVKSTGSGDEATSESVMSEETNQAGQKMSVWQNDGTDLEVQAKITDMNTSDAGETERMKEVSYQIEELESENSKTGKPVLSGKIENQSWTEGAEVVAKGGFSASATYDEAKNLYLNGSFGKTMFKDTGIYRVTVTADDAAGNSSSSTILVRVDTTAPVKEQIKLNLTSGEGSTAVVKDAVNQNITATKDKLENQQKVYLKGLTSAALAYEDAALISTAEKVEVKIFTKASDKDTFVENQTVTAARTPAEGEITFPELDQELTTVLQELANGSAPIYYMKINVTDRAGNETTVYTDAIYADTTAPTVTVSGYDFDKWTSDDVVLTVEAEDSGSGIEKISFDGGKIWQYAEDFGEDSYLKNDASTDKKEEANTQTSRQKFTFKKKYAENAAVDIRVRDRAGNESAVVDKQTQFAIDHIDKLQPTGGTITNAAQFTEDKWYHADQIVEISYKTTKGTENANGTNEYVQYLVTEKDQAVSNAEWKTLKEYEGNGQDISANLNLLLDNAVSEEIASLTQDSANVYGCDQKQWKVYVRVVDTVWTDNYTKKNLRIHYLNANGTADAKTDEIIDITNISATDTEVNDVDTIARRKHGNLESQLTPYWVNLDSTAPVINEVSFKEENLPEDASIFQKIKHLLSQGIFFKKEQVTATVDTDASISGLAKVEWFVENADYNSTVTNCDVSDEIWKDSNKVTTTSGETDEEKLTFTAPKTKGYLHVRVTDQAGNATVYNSELLIVDNVAPAAPNAAFKEITGKTTKDYTFAGDKTKTGAWTNNEVQITLTQGDDTTAGLAYYEMRKATTEAGLANALWEAIGEIDEEGHLYDVTASEKNVPENVITISNADPSAQYYQFRAVSRTGVEGTATGVYQVRIDATKPDSAKLMVEDKEVSENTTYNTSQAALSYTNKKAKVNETEGAAIYAEYKITSKDGAVYTGNGSDWTRADKIEKLTTGTYKILVRTVDEAGNYDNEDGTEKTLRIDNGKLTKFEASLNYAEDGKVYQNASDTTAEWTNKALNLKVHAESKSPIYYVEILKQTSGTGEAQVVERIYDKTIAESGYLSDDSVIRKTVDVDGDLDKGYSLDWTYAIPEQNTDGDLYDIKVVTRTSTETANPTVFETTQWTKDSINGSSKNAFEVNYDKTAPTFDLGTASEDGLTIGDVKFESTNTSTLSRLANTLTFGYFFKESVKVTVTVHDKNDSLNGSGVKDFYYKVGDGKWTKDNVKVTPSVTAENKANRNSDGIYTVTFTISKDSMDKITDISMYAVDCAGNEMAKEGEAVKVLKNFVVDENKPVIEIASSGTRNDDAEWYRSDVMIDVNATDAKADNAKNVSGLNQITYTIKDSADHVITTYTKDFRNGKTSGENVVSLFTTSASDGEYTLTSDGTYTIEASVTDNAGNTYSTTYGVKIDKTAPEFSLDEKVGETEYDHQWTAGSVVITPTESQDNLSGVTYYYRLKSDNASAVPVDGSAVDDSWTKVKENVALSNNQTNAVYEFIAVSGSGKVVSKDSGFISITNSKQNDTAAELPVLHTEGTYQEADKDVSYTSEKWVNQDVSMKAYFSKNDSPYGGVKAYYYQLDGASTWTQITTNDANSSEIAEQVAHQIQVENGKTEKHTITFKAVSQTDVEIGGKPWNIWIDKTVPAAATLSMEKEEQDVTLIANGEEGENPFFSTDTVTVTSPAADDGSAISVAYRLNSAADAEWIPLSGNTITGLQNGVNTLEIRTKDEAGNKVDKTYEIHTETTKPELVSVAMKDVQGEELPTNTWTNGAVTVTLTGTSSAGAEIVDYEYRMKSSTENEWTEWTSITVDGKGSLDTTGKTGIFKTSAEETAGTNYQFRVKTASGSYSTDENAAKNQQLVKIDTTKPVITTTNDNITVEYVKATGVRALIKQLTGTLFFGDRIKVTIAAADQSKVANSGVNAIYYKVTSTSGTKDSKYTKVEMNNINTNTAEITIDPNDYNGTVTLYAYATDVAGNTGVEKQFSNLFGDVTEVNAPNVTATAGSDDYNSETWTKGDIVYAITNTQDIPSGIYGFEYSTDNKNWIRVIANDVNGISNSDSNTGVIYTFVPTVDSSNAATLTVQVENEKSFTGNLYFRTVSNAKTDENTYVTGAATSAYAQKVDKVTPVVKITKTDEKVTDADDGWPTKTTLTFNTEEKIASGILRYEYQIGDGQWQSANASEDGSGTLEITTSVDATVKVRAVSGTEITSEEKSVDVKVYNKKPETPKITATYGNEGETQQEYKNDSDGQAPWVNAPVTIRPTISNDELGQPLKYYYSTDGGTTKKELSADGQVFGADVKNVNTTVSVYAKTPSGQWSEAATQDISSESDSGQSGRWRKRLVQDSTGNFHRGTEGSRSCSSNHDNLCIK